MNLQYAYIIQEPIVVVGIRHILGVWDDEPLAVAEPNAVQHQSAQLDDDESRSPPPIGVVHQAEVLAPLDDGRRIVEHEFHRIPGYTEHQQGEYRARGDGLDQESEHN